MAAIVCGACGCPHFTAGAIEPGFVVGCAICQTTHERGVIIRCARCELQSCGEGMYQLYLTIRERALQRPD